MNKKKIIFLVGLGLLVLFLIIIAIVLSSSKSNKKSNIKASNFKIWILQDSKEDFNSFLDDFKKATKNTNLVADVETFDNYEDYNMALASAILKGKAPDLYMLNNNEKSIFIENAIGLDPEIISPDDMRKSFFPFFGDDLIYSVGEKDNKTEFLIGVPFGYETLGLYFNLSRVLDVKKLKSFPEIQNFISDFHEKRPEYVALGIGKGSTVFNSENIFTQFIMAEGANNINDINSGNIKKAFSEYFSYNSGDNGYIKLHDRLSKSGKTNIDAFVDGDIAMIFGFPRLINKIDELGFSKRKLRVTLFPDFINESKRLINYNYFVLNKNSQNKQMAYEILKYMFSEAGEKAYLKNFKYYIPARISVYSELKDKEINDNFYVKLKDFFNQEAEYSSFDKGIKNVYDKELVKLLDDEVGYLSKGVNFVSSLKCRTLKVINLEKLSDSCK